MDNITVLLVIIVVINLVVSIWLLVNRRQKDNNQQSIDTLLAQLKGEIAKQQNDNLISLKSSLDSSNRMLNDRLSEGTQALDRRMAVLGEIENKLGQLSTQTDNIESIGKNIQSLSDLLKPPKIRGGLGEMFLENLLREILPESLIETQYRFKNGQRVDAVVKIADRLLPIDSKFPLEAFRRMEQFQNDEVQFKQAQKDFSTAVKKHIDDIADKYIRPDEKTLELAVMYIPAEAIYSRLIGGEEAERFEYALSRKVIPSSPGHLYGFLATIAALYIESSLSSDKKYLVENIKKIQIACDELKKYSQRLNGSLNSASLSNEKSIKELERIFEYLDKLLNPDNNQKAI